jgi:ABC-2 type transport system ATP-binding protein
MQTIILDNVTKKFDAFFALNGISLSVNAGEIFAFLGPNGAGKTTTIKILTGLLKPTSGTAKVLGLDILQNIDSIKSKIALVPDQPYVYPYLTAFEYMTLIANIYKLPESEAQKSIPELLNMFELSDRSGDIIDSFSHGMKQKLVLASTLLHKPEVMFLDEPLVGLDPKSARLVKDIFTRLAQNGITIFMCTHVLEIAERIANRIAIINNGKIAELGTLSELKNKMASDGNLEELYLKLTAPGSGNFSGF